MMYTYNLRTQEADGPSQSLGQLEIHIKTKANPKNFNWLTNIK